MAVSKTVGIGCPLFGSVRAGGRKQLLSAGVQPCRRLAGMGMGDFAPKQGQHFGIYPQDVCSRRTAAGLGVESGRRVPGVGRGDAADFPAGRRMVGKGKDSHTGSAVEPVAAAPLEGWCGQRAKPAAGHLSGRHYSSGCRVAQSDFPDLSAGVRQTSFVTAGLQPVCAGASAGTGGRRGAMARKRSLPHRAVAGSGSVGAAKLLAAGSGLPDGTVGSGSGTFVDGAAAAAKRQKGEGGPALAGRTADAAAVCSAADPVGTVGTFSAV